MIIDEIAGEITRSISQITSSIDEAFEPTIRLGVTGLSRAGKTVFITGLVANLLNTDRMPGLKAAVEGRIQAATLEPQPDPTLARFDYEAHLQGFFAKDPVWPEGTKAVSELRLSFRVTSKGVLGAVRGTKTVHLDIIDYPGEWLLDLGLMTKSYADWSTAILERLAHHQIAGEAAFLDELAAFQADEVIDEVKAKALSERFRAILLARHKAGFSDLAPGRFLLPGELEGSPVITFCPLPNVKNPARKSYYRQFESRFDAYKSKVIKPFFRNHFARLDRQVVLVDLLGALDLGPDALFALEESMADILSAFKTGRNNIFSFLLGRSIDRIAFVATKADLLHHKEHEKLIALLRAVLARAERKAQYSGAKVAAKAVAGLRSTVEEERKYNGEMIPAVRGRHDDGKEVSFYFGDLPSDPEGFLIAARASKDFGEFEFHQEDFAPPLLQRRGQGGLPHIRLDQVAEFLIGDKF